MVGEIESAILVVVVYLFVFVFGVLFGGTMSLGAWFLRLALFNALAHQFYLIKIPN